MTPEPVLPGTVRETIPVFTIGYGSRTLDDFVRVLQSYHIEFVFDCAPRRTHASSRSSRKTRSKRISASTPSATFSSAINWAASPRIVTATRTTRSCMRR